MRNSIFPSPRKKKKRKVIVGKDVKNYFQCKTADTYGGQNLGRTLTQVFPIPRITTISVVLLPENFEAIDSLINEHSAPESKQNRNDSPW